MSLQNKFLSKELSDKFWKEGLTLATAESCTAGNIGNADLLHRQISYLSFQLQSVGGGIGGKGCGFGRTCCAAYEEISVFVLPDLLDGNIANKIETVDAIIVIHFVKNLKLGAVFQTADDCSVGIGAVTDVRDSMTGSLRGGLCIPGDSPGRCRQSGNQCAQGQKTGDHASKSFET